ncbi:GATOR complex protein MIOS isoform X1 [Carcharodon carcharias]|uniref:GATOR complex protein MIOS isoform X1 n=1 Tax=Carcharodon carcharias TaxID=13397 RepID=UPI001B7EF9B5|nr:GATOR complex protein MIOS isoform X1 [Carcharodon carcharias]XP_041039604.1 GATOR complex protein MIOS isoform X1 [Carcharodon carcharias]XP_041039605.1 GATOR complex protein MIOS isoform X1 [Carcharodon carcharias]XP_041039606.1 GATOR complex protein MIOS isoform X1 [Carcharodon carcharias]XP_041039607.1 GATOR complex protein MIOS isoform X1 [Carcharodon carcharias]XP_041039608.1 GATOR complex protein MIOS isoform X1 [Carcharodon carcharias]
MSGSKPDILWAPHHVDRFVVCDSELCLYRTESVGTFEAKAGSLRLSEDTTATLLAINSDTPYMKCVAWYPKYDPECLLAVGQANGRVVLTSLGQDRNSKCRDLIGKEFVPKHARQCNTLAWNPVDSNWLAAGLDKHRADFSVLIWDISSKYTPEIAVPAEKVRLSAGDTDAGLVVTKPLYELGQNDASLSLCWLPRDQKLLLAGMHRNLAIFDLRNTSQKIFVNTKAVQGVTVDPHFHDRVASFFEGQVAIWDLRKFEKPVLTLTEQPKPLTKVTWCPTRTGLLATLTRDSNIIRLYDMQHTPTPIGDETEPTIIERSVQPCENYIASFAWHPTNQNRMVVVTPNRLMSDFTVFERISLAWSPTTSLMWACGRHLYNCNEEGETSSGEKDVATKMRQRALSRYGLDTEQVWRNHLLAGDDDLQLKSLWYTLHFMKQYAEDAEQKSVNKVPHVYSGIKTIVKSSAERKTECYKHGWTGSDRQTDFIRYQSEERCLALQLCGWIQKGPEIDVGPFLNALEQGEEWERAAAVALFNLDIRRSIEILNKGAALGKGDLNLNVVAMALSGYTDEKNSLWREMCSSLRLQLNNPYLCVMFAFLTSEPGSYDCVLYESSVAVRDRVAFANMFLNDTQILRYIDKLTNEMKEAGNLEGILLTGLTKDGIDLMESYVDRTGDVQTASFCMLQGFPSDVVKDPRVQYWIENYRNLLDAWRFWHKRAEFDIHRSKLDPFSKPLAQVFVSCNFCGKSISFSCSTMPHQGRSFSQYGVSGSPTKSKVTSCPGCRKPLPRCALCLINMGTPVSSCLGTGKSDEKVDLSKDKKLAQFNNWFTWCQNCRHGGHAGHMLSWFRDHNECPVSACTCKCMQLDTTGNLIPAEISQS